MRPAHAPPSAPAFGPRHDVTRASADAGAVRQTLRDQEPASRPAVKPAALGLAARTWQRAGNPVAAERTLGRPIRVAVIDDHAFWIEMLADTFAQPAHAGRFTLIGWATRLDEVHMLAAKGPADVALVDFSLPDGHGTDAVPVLKSAWPRCRVVLLTDRDHPLITRAALGVTIDALLSKASSKGAVLDMIARAAAGEFLIARELQEQLRERAKGPSGLILRLPRPLTPRERGALEALLWTATTERAAAKMGVGPATFRTHIMHAMQKLDVRTRWEAVTLSLWAGLILPPDPLSPLDTRPTGAAPIAPPSVCPPAFGNAGRNGDRCAGGHEAMQRLATGRGDGGQARADALRRWRAAEQTAIAARQDRVAAEAAAATAASAAGAAITAADAARAALSAASRAEASAAATATAAKIAASHAGADVADARGQRQERRRGDLRRDRSAGRRPHQTPPRELSVTSHPRRAGKKRPPAASSGRRGVGSAN